jgi:hypothetical protein
MKSLHNGSIYFAVEKCSQSVYPMYSSIFIIALNIIFFKGLQCAVRISLHFSSLYIDMRIRYSPLTKGIPWFNFMVLNFDFNGWDERAFFVKVQY